MLSPSSADVAHRGPYATLLESLRGVSWPARRSSVAALPGVHSTRIRGSSTELTEYRLYRQGDDPRRLDWRLLARSDRAYVRLGDERAIRSTMIVIDASASMGFPEETLDKWRQARLIAVGLAAVAASHGDPVGLAVATTRGTRLLAPRARRDVLGEMVRALDAIRPEGGSPIAPVLATLNRSTRIALITDFLGDEEDTRRRAGEIAAGGGQVHAVHVVAAEELEPPARAMLAVDPEDPSISRPLGIEGRPAYVAAFSEWRGSLARRWRAGGLTYTEATTTEIAARVVRRIVAESEDSPS